ncbi:unknown [Haloarcula marismortui ATCC 43049]|uniref:Uncharacterized protein n=1 Tax=Haloarcula marismortui (strain ATCC 43049 / DSM 3752 / JCM 8966 / VKM B-1809) TaxID=272569 RepID=Q5V3D0_HALMA|nr:unknown [Haloarcula marismortui ATCC 43049]
MGVKYDLVVNDTVSIGEAIATTGNASSVWPIST